MSGTWRAQCVGTVVAVDLLPIDKTGRGERFIATLTVAPDTIEADEPGVTFGATLDFALDSARLRHKLGRDAVAGDRVRIEGTGTGVRPRRVNIETITLVVAQETEA